MASNQVCNAGLKCNKKDRCRFQHPEGDDSNDQPPKPTIRMKCRNIGSCKFGSQCRFDHSDDPTIPPSLGPIIPGPVENRKKSCRFGPDCRNKSECQFDHSPSEINDPKLSSMVEKLMTEFQEQLRVSEKTHIKDFCYELLIIVLEKCA
jgi:hypothetical protein